MTIAEKTGADTPSPYADAPGYATHPSLRKEMSNWV